MVACATIEIRSGKIYSQIAQSVEQMTVNHWVGGSSPSLGAKIGEVAEWFNALVLKTSER